MVKPRSAQGANPIAVGADIASKRLKNDIEVPNQHDVNAKLFRDLSESFSNKGERPRGFWGVGGNAFFKGLEAAQNSKSVEQRRQKVDETDRVMQYFQEVNNSLIERNQWYEKRENAKREVTPQILAYMDNIDSLDPQSQRLMAQDILAQYGKAIGEDFKLSSIDGSNPFLMTIESSKGQQLFDVRSMFAGDEAAQQAIAMKMPEYQKKLQEERSNKQKELDLREKELYAKYPNFKKQQGLSAGGIGGAGQEQEQTLTVGDHTYEVGDLGSLQKSAQAHYEKKVLDANEAIPKNNQAIEAIETMRSVFKRNENIGNSFLHLLDKSDDSDSVWSIMFRKAANKQDLADLEILRKATNDLQLDVILGVTGKTATDIFKRAVKAANPDGKLTKLGFDAIADKLERKAYDANELIMAKYNALRKGQTLSPISRVRNKKSGSDKDDFSDLGRLAQ